MSHRTLVPVDTDEFFLLFFFFRERGCSRSVRSLIIGRKIHVIEAKEFKKCTRLESTRYMRRSSPRGYPLSGRYRSGYHPRTIRENRRCRRTTRTTGVSDTRRRPRHQVSTSLSSGLRSRRVRITASGKLRFILP